MRNENERIRRIELALTPEQVALLWIKDTVQANLDAPCLKGPFPREVIAKSISASVTKSLSGKPQMFIQQAVQQAMREADRLYQIFVAVNLEVQEGLEQRRREYFLVYHYLRPLIFRPLSYENEERLQQPVLCFCKPTIIMESALNQISAERFGGLGLLCSDSESELGKQVEMVNHVLEWFNCVADRLEFKRLSVEEMRDRWRADIDEHVSEWINLAKLETLAAYGQPKEFIDALRTSLC